MKHPLTRTVPLLLAAAGTASLGVAQAQEPGTYGNYTDSTEPSIPSEAAARETLRLSREQSSLRVAGLDLFPHAAATVAYDDNILISATNQIDDVIWTLSPGLTIAGGNVASYLPSAVTVEQLRGLLYYSLVEDVSKPTRFFALDYTPSFNFYTENSKHNFIGQSGKFSGGYSLTRLALGLDFDYEDTEVKNNDVGTLTEIATYNPRLRTRYDFTDRTSLEVNGQYYLLSYADDRYQGYDQLGNENWLNHQFADRLNLGLGAGFGLFFPDASDDQTYEQILTRAVYRLSGKLYFSSAIGVEFRQYDSGQSGTIHPVFSLTSVYQARENTQFVFEGHRRDQPSPYANYNYATFGGSANIRQLLFTRLTAIASLGYDYTEYRNTGNATDISRTDDYLFGRLRFEYEFNRHLLGAVYYNYLRDDSSLDSFSYDNNIVGLQLQWRF
jgi:hypothetical protein